MMMLRSSSTPLLGSLLPSESPNNYHHHHRSSPSPNLHPVTCHFSPASDGLHDQSPSLGIRRTRSDGNLHSILSDHSDDPHHLPSMKCCSSSSQRVPHPSFETIPPFPVYNPVAEEVEEEEEEEEEEDEEENEGAQDEGVKARDSRSGSAAAPLFLARGLGIDRIASGLLNVGGDGRCSSGGGGGRKYDVSTGNGGEQSDVETHYKKMVEENPSNSLFLRNYAEFLYQAKGDLKRAEEYYSRAILVDPGDGEILSQYAKLVWELHHDEERATNYFQRAVNAAPQDCHVLAAYAEFLWGTGEDDGDGGADGGRPQDFVVKRACSGALAPATA